MAPWQETWVHNGAQVGGRLAFEGKDRTRDAGRPAYSTVKSKEERRQLSGECSPQKGLEAGRLANVGQTGPLQDRVEVGREPWPEAGADGGGGHSATGPL